MPSTTTALRTQFFDYLFGEEVGYLCIATGNAADKEKKGFKQSFFNWPEQRADVGSFIEAAARKDVWFCTSLLERAERKKRHCLPGTLVWADLDECDPENVDPSPSVIIESSPGRYQALWRLDDKIEPFEQEEYARRIAYANRGNGADPTGWDLTQLLRVPLTFNYKYGDPHEVKLHRTANVKVPVDLFKSMEVPQLPEGDVPDVDMPNPLMLPDPENVIYKYMMPLTRTGAFNELYTITPNPDDDWSARLWRLINICLEAGMTMEETFTVANSSECNKYARDDRPIVYLWRDVLKAGKAQRSLEIFTGIQAFLTMPDLVNQSEVVGTCFIDDYKEWASEATDAIEEFHELSAAIMLSAVMASGIHLRLDYGTMVPNLWGLILGDSTLTRKTTAMRMAVDFISDIDTEMILATDGSAEGLLSGLSNRPNRTSIYFKDEVSGFFDSINKKDYLAGMPEILTQLYDVPRIFTRRLRKETITISQANFIFFGGGIRDRVYSLVTDEYILSGFLPRFLIVSGEADLKRLKRTGPARSTESSKRDALLARIANLHEYYNGNVTVKIGDQETELARKFEANLTNDAWQRYGDIEEMMVNIAHESPLSMVALPTFERLSRSLLKLATLLAAAENPPQDGGFDVEEKHVVHAASYIQKWGKHTVDLVQSSGKGTTERLLDKIYNSIKKNPNILRGQLMQRYHLSSREANEILGTLEDRGMINATKAGRGYRYIAL